ncbi:MAG: methyltransferase [Candidatus Paracaedibacteraceae bacterium]|nr:methyltransferase [Candidatus Paracaedibacteraceae bacterium]
MMTKKEIIKTTGQVTVFSLNSDGEGVGIDLETGNNITIPFVLPGEKVTYECQHFKKKKKYVATEYLVKSADRIAPVCKHFTQCGGCMLQHMNATMYRDFKHSQITNAMVKEGLDPFFVDGITILPFGKRRRANLDAIRKGDDIFLGFHKFRSHSLINVEECFTMDPALTRLLEPLRQAFAIVLEPYQKAKIFFTLTHVGIDMSLEVQGIDELEEPKRQALKAFAEKMNVTRFVFRHRKFLDVIHQTAVPVVQFAEIDVTVDAYSFLQATVESDAHLANYVLAELIPDATNIVDLFCGRGTLSLPLASRAPVTGYEFDKPALAALEKAAPNATHSIDLHLRDLFNDPLTRDELKSFDVVVIDPPRAGAEAQSFTLATCNAKQIIYVSCNAETFARDARILTEGNFSLRNVHGVDQFAWSPHIEVVAIFVRS